MFQKYIQKTKGAQDFPKYMEGDPGTGCQNKGKEKKMAQNAIALEYFVSRGEACNNN